ncbi:hypothetical protein VKT23_012781 [Stygiomarasmius scandens]|uniref:DDE-1 domain-containing protein n=1 Tax=Marasmiellus scandens TaxID=2682957 RepID=A0ABR1J7U1_9AGAR
MDESGFPPSNQGRERVVGYQGTKTQQHKQGSANHKNVTAIVTICGDGTKLHPTIIFKGQRFQSKWQNDNIAEASWTDGEIALQWMKKDFDPMTPREG